MSSDWPNIKSRLAGLLNERAAENFLLALEEIEVEISHWVKGQLFLMVVIGCMSYIGLKLVGVEYALALALFSATHMSIPKGMSVFSR